jgi:hypothetical protein
LHDDELTTEKGLTGSIMDYVPVNIAQKGEEQGQYWQTTLGPYDYWAIEYAHKPIDAETTEDEVPELEKIASKVADPDLAYGTDEDAFPCPQGIDPSCNRYDLGEDMLAYHRMQVELAKELWGRMESHFEKPGTRYRKIRRVFENGLYQYQMAVSNTPKYIGGIYHYRDHVGDPDGRLPFEPVPAAKQREVIDFIAAEFLSPDAFKLPADLLNKLAPDRFEDFHDSNWNMRRIDYPLHETVGSMQNRLVNSLYQPLMLARMLDIELRYGEDDDRFTIAELFEKLRNSIWSELQEPENINSFRRELQRKHLSKLIDLAIRPSQEAPQDASSLARMDLINIKNAIEDALPKNNLNTYTRAHLDETIARIQLALNPVVQRNL